MPKQWDLCYQGLSRLNGTICTGHSHSEDWITERETLSSHLRQGPALGNKLPPSSSCFSSTGFIHQFVSHKHNSSKWFCALHNHPFWYIAFDAEGFMFPQWLCEVQLLALSPPDIFNSFWLTSNTCPQQFRALVTHLSTSQHEKRTASRKTHTAFTTIPVTTESIFRRKNQVIFLHRLAGEQPLPAIWC